MNTDDLVALIDQAAATQRRQGTEPHVTIASLSDLSGRPRRSIEEAIQSARLDGAPVITDGGIRVARTAADARSLAGWIAARIATQRATLNAIEAVAMEWELREAREVPGRRREATEQQTLALVEA